MARDQDPANEEEGRGNEIRYLRADDLKEYAEKFDLSALRSRVAAEPMLPSRTFTEWENTPSWMVAYAVVSALVQVSVVSGAHFFMVAYGRRITPHCGVYYVPGLSDFTTDTRKWEENMCYITTFAFWTYPVVCPLAVIFLYWKNLLDKRLFYEALLNKIFLQFRSHSFLSSPTFWFLALYGLCACFCLYYIKDTEVVDMGYTELIFSLLAYLAPMTAFLIVLFTTWSVNWHIVTLPKYVEQDRVGAIKLLEDCTYVASADMCLAFEAVEWLFDDLAAKKKFTPQMTTSEILRLSLDMHEKGLRPPGLKCDCWCYQKYITHWWFRSYWASRFLYYKYLDDSRSWAFRRWSYLYHTFMIIAVFIFIWAWMYTMLAFTIYEHERMPKGIGPHEVLPGAVKDALESMGHNVTRNTSFL
eukprot:gnl/TRDRNA2_/TRDRNA2_191056_c0_seq1.p1 gnl/TRDRNA2_/TRDRNA2_191056_c0~~gnl/TRDRNA2_/TRDRNA2_191056_c0_seq1.p1  ORF type:complete len:415 (-),score=54.20 gnl/TRDRNA2_/TRDRNA2_191056_c0_seq1:68-1312(-)